MAWNLVRLHGKVLDGHAHCQVASHIREGNRDQKPNCHNCKEQADRDGSGSACVQRARQLERMKQLAASVPADRTFADVNKEPIATSASSTAYPVAAAHQCDG